MDTWVNHTKPNADYGSDPQLHIRPSGFVDRRGLVFFNLTEIPQDFLVTSAVLYLTNEDGDNYLVELHRIIEPWTESTNWDTQPAFDPAVSGGFQLDKNLCTRAAYVDISLVQSWIDSPGTNYGLMLYPPDGSGDVAFSSREGSSPPVLVITLQKRVPLGLPTFLRPLVEVLVFLLGIVVLSGYSGALSKLFRTRAFSR
jgi:hypothetical protein